MIIRSLRLGVIVFGLLVVSFAVKAQPGSESTRIGFISSSTVDISSPLLVALRQALSELGHVEGKDLLIEYRFGKKTEDLAGFAADLVSRKVHLILAGGSEAVAAAKNVTTTVPIVMTNSGDPVRAGFVASLGRPSGNITGLTQISPALANKRVDLLKEAIPTMTRVGILWNPRHPNTPWTFKETRVAAERLYLQALSFEVGEHVDLADAIATAGKSVDAIVVLRDPFTARHRGLIAKLHSRTDCLRSTKPKITSLQVG